MASLEGKKIIYLITQSNSGGAQKYILRLAQHFVKKNKILIAVGEAKHQDPFFFQECRKLGIEPIVLQNLVRDVSLVKGFEAVLEMRKLLLKERPDILHVNSSMAGTLGSCASWISHLDPMNKITRVVYTVHGFVFNEPLPRAKKLIYLAAEKISASWKHAIITVSQFDKNEGLRRKIAPEKRMVVINIGIDPTLEFLSINEARTALGIDSDKPIIGTIASLYKTKGLEFLIDAAEELQSKNLSFKIYILGDGPERNRLTERLHQKQLAADIILLGSKPDAYRFVKAFDIFALPSMKEGFPYALLEAGLAGLPLLRPNPAPGP